MALVRWEPVRELTSLQNEMNRLFTTVFDTPTSGNGETAARRWIPAMDLAETDEHFVLKADLPGLGEGDVNIEVEDNVLTVSGERRPGHTPPTGGGSDQDKREGYVRIERSYGAFRRSLTLPEGIDPEAVTASFDNGVLEVVIPKPEERKPRRVAIQVGARPAAIEGDEAA